MMPSPTPVAAPTVKAAKRNAKTPRAVAAEKTALQSLFSLRQSQQLLAFAKNGGKAAGWGLLGNAAGLTVALAISAPQLFIFGTIGSMVGFGLYGVRALSTIKSARLEPATDELLSIKTMRTLDVIDDAQLQTAREKILKKYGLA